MPRARHSSDFHYFPSSSSPSSSYAAHDPEVSPGILLSLVSAGIFILYSLLHAPLRLPPLSDVVFIMIGAVLGPGVRETLQNAFSSGGRSVAERVRTRAASLVGGVLMPGGYGGGGGEGFVGGLWNTGNTCYQNSVLQAMASLCHLKPHLASLVMSEDEHELNPSEALMSLIAALNTLTPNPRASTPSAVIVRGTDNSGWVRNEQQDAQEFFQKLTGALEKEVTRFLDRRKRRTRMGLEGAVECAGDVKKRGVWRLPELGAALGKEYRSPFEGLFAQRVGCLRCGYVEAISLQPFTSLSLSLPSSWACSLEECLDEFTAIEQIQEVDCDKCTLLTLHAQLQHLASQTLAEGVKSQLTPRIKALEAALDNDDFSPKIPGVKISPRQKISSTKTKQTMIARPPPILVLHFNRSQYDIVTGMTGKNYAAVTFPARMDLGRLGVVTRHDTEGGSWGLVVDPARRMSGRMPRWLFPKQEDESEQSESDAGTPPPPGTLTPSEPDPETDSSNTTEDGQEDAEAEKREAIEPAAASGESIIYDLKSVVAHYGGHHNGHYISYRKQRQQWFKISDHEVFVCDEKDALSAGNAFMLFYERAPAECKLSANGNITGYAHANGTIDEAEVSDSTSNSGAEMSDSASNNGETDDDDLTLANGSANGNGIALKQLDGAGLRRRRGSGASR